MEKIRNIAASLSLVISTIILSPSALAVDKPLSCPSISAITNAGLRVAYKEEKYSMYIAAQVSNYELLEQWAFFIGMPYDQAIDEMDATNKSIAALAGLTGSPSPRYYRKQWYCQYENSYQYTAIALTPVPNVSPQSFYQIMKLSK
jgi:hypothetical protein